MPKDVLVVGVINISNPKKYDRQKRLKDLLKN